MAADTVQPDPHSSYTAIPDEQLESILSIAISRPDEGLQLALTCKRWYRVGIPFIFRFVVVHPNNIEAFLGRLTSSLQTEDDENQEGVPGLGKYVKEVICVAGPRSGAKLGPSDLQRLFKLCPSIEDLFLARFWHQWFHDALSKYPSLAKVKKFGWLHDYAPLPNPSPNEWIGQFRTWPALESLTLRMLSFMGGPDGFAAVTTLLGASNNSDNSTELPAIVPDPQSKLKEFVLVGNMVPPRSLVTGLAALRAPLEVLEVNGVALLGPAGIVQALQLVGARLRELRIVDDGRIGAIGNMQEVLLPDIKKLCPALQVLVLHSVSFPQHCFQYLPEGLKKLSVSQPGPLGALELLDVLQKTRNHLQRLEELQWTPGKVEEGWDDANVESLLDWGKGEFIRILLPAHKENDD